MDFRVWKKIKLEIETPAQAGKLLKDFGIRFDWADFLLTGTLFEHKGEVDVIVLTVADLGFSAGASYSEICQKSKDYGLELCLPQVAPELRLQYKDQPAGEWLALAMKPMMGFNGKPEVFGVGHSSGALWLRTYFASPHSFWLAKYKFVFCLPAKK